MHAERFCNVEGRCGRCGFSTDRGYGKTQGAGKTESLSAGNSMLEKCAVLCKVWGVE